MHMSSRKTALLVVGVLALAGAALMFGCSDGGEGLATGAVAGYVFTAPDGSQIIVKGLNEPPEGFLPCTEAIVYVDGVPFTVDAVTAFYLVGGLEPGLHTIVIEGCGQRIEFQVIVIPGETTRGTGHEEGGT